MEAKPLLMDSPHTRTVWWVGSGLLSNPTMGEPLGGGGARRSKRNTRYTA